MAFSLNSGITVEVYWEDEEKWFEGVLDARTTDEGWSVVYDDGDSGNIDSVFDNPHVRVLGDSHPEPTDIVVGDHVKCLFGDDGWFRGVIRGIPDPESDEQYYEVKFDDGDFRDDVKIDEVKLFSLMKKQEVNNENQNSQEDQVKSVNVPNLPSFEKVAIPVMKNDVSPRKLVLEQPPGMHTSPLGQSSGDGPYSSPSAASLMSRGGHSDHSSISDRNHHQNQEDLDDVDYDSIDLWFVPSVDAHTQAQKASIAAGLQEPKRSDSLSLGFTLSSSANPGTRLAAMQIKCEALEGVRLEREMRGSAWEEHGGMGHAPGGDEAGWKLVENAVMKACVHPGGIKGCLEQVQDNGSKPEGAGGGGDNSFPNISEFSDENKLMVSLIGSEGAGHGGALWEALLQVRVRALALVRLHYGPGPSLPLVQATARLARTYAHQSLWPQVGVHVGRALEVLRAVEEGAGIDTELNTDSHGMKKVASGVLACFDALRGCACEFSGTIPWDHLVGMVGEDDSGHPSQHDHTSQKTNSEYAVRLSTPYGVRQNIAPRNGSVMQMPPRSGLARLDPTAAPISKSSTQQQSNIGGRVSGGNHRSMRWGDAVSFLRNHHAGLKKMVQQLERGVRDDHLAMLMLAFTAAQPKDLGQSENINGATEATSTNPLLCGGSVVPHTRLADELTKRHAFTLELGSWCVERMCELLTERKSAVFLGDSDYGGKVVDGHSAAVPLSWEEAVAILVIAIGESNKHTSDKEKGAASKVGEDEEEEEEDDDGSSFGKVVEPTGFEEIWKGRLKVELLLLEAQMLQHTGKLNTAEDRIKALHKIFKVNDWGDSMVACGAHTSAAELYVQKHMARKEVRADKTKEAAEDWLASDEGHTLWRSEVKRLLTESRESGKRLTRLELEYRARQALLKAKIESINKANVEDKDEQGNEVGPMNAKPGSFMDRAEESLLRVWEIHESSLGRNHPSTASSCLSLGNLCVITRDLPQAKLWFDSAKQVLDVCFDNKCMQVTAATETQLGHVQAKLDQKEEAAAHLERAAEFHLHQSRLCRDSLATSEGAAMSCLDIAENRRKFWSAKQANSLFSEAAGHWISVASSYSESDARTERKFAKKAVVAQEKAVTAVGLMYGKSGDASTEGSKVLIQALKILAAAYEVAGEWRKAADTYAKQKSIAARVLGPNSKSAKSASHKHRKAAGKAAKHRVTAKPISPGGSRQQRSRSPSPSTSTHNMSSSPRISPMRKSVMAETTCRRSPSPPASPVDFTGEESWLR
jgi:tetratricopeptide (TPR) repeat protein